MRKWFEVKMVTVTIMLIEVNDKPMFHAGSPADEATDIAFEDAPMCGTSEVEEVNPIEHKFFASCKQHADIVRTIDGDGDKG